MRVRVRDVALTLARKICPHNDRDAGILDYGREQAWECTVCGRYWTERRAV